MGSEEYSIRAQTEVIGKDQNAVQRSLLFQFNRVGVSSAASSEFRLQITDPDDPLFLYDFESSSAQFQEMKREQKLFFDFGGFGESLKQLLAEINRNAKKYRAVIDEHQFQKPTLMFQKVTNISLLVTLQLTLAAADDSRLKEYLSREAQLYKSDLAAANAKLHESKQTIQSLKQSYEARIAEMQQAIEESRNTHDREQSKLRSSYETRINELQSQQEMTKQSLGEGFVTKEQSLVAKYESQVSNLKAAVSRLQQENQRLEGTMQLQAEQIKQNKRQYSEHRDRHRSLEEEKRSLNDQLVEMCKRVAVLETESEAAKAQSQALNKILDERKLVEGRDGSRCDALQKDLHRKEQEIEKMRSEMEVLVEKANDRDWIAEKSRDFIMKQGAKLSSAVAAYHESQEYCARLSDALQEAQIRMNDAEERLKKVTVSLEQEKHGTQKMRAETAKLKDDIAKLDTELAAEKQFSQCLRTQFEKNRELKKCHAQATRYGAGHDLSGENAQGNSDGGDKPERRKSTGSKPLKSLPRELFINDDTLGEDGD
jgi:chromosome segregation ATPase